MFLLVMGVVGFIYRKICKPQSPSKRLGQKVMITVGLFLVAVAIDYMYSAWCESSGHLPGNQEAINANLMKLPILTMLQVRLFGPISEELVFRGLTCHFVFVACLFCFLGLVCLCDYFTDACRFIAYLSKTDLANVPSIALYHNFRIIASAATPQSRVPTLGT